MTMTLKEFTVGLSALLILSGPMNGFSQLIGSENASLLPLSVGNYWVFWGEGGPQISVESTITIRDVDSDTVYEWRWCAPS
jgi:hypothetical protein